VPKPPDAWRPLNVFQSGSFGQSGRFFMAESYHGVSDSPPGLVTATSREGRARSQATHLHPPHSRARKCRPKGGAKLSIPERSRVLHGRKSSALRTIRGCRAWLVLNDRSTRSRIASFTSLPRATFLSRSTP
jgi:hypothetical protein